VSKNKVAILEYQDERERGGEEERERERERKHAHAHARARAKERFICGVAYKLTHQVFVSDCMTLFLHQHRQAADMLTHAGFATKCIEGAKPVQTNLNFCMESNRDFLHSKHIQNAHSKDSHMFVCFVLSTFTCNYWVATIDRLLEIIGLFCKRDIEKRHFPAKENYKFKEPTNRSHPIPHPCWSSVTS